MFCVSVELNCVKVASVRCQHRWNAKQCLYVSDRPRVVLDRTAIVTRTPQRWSYLLKETLARGGFRRSSSCSPFPFAVTFLAPPPLTTSRYETLVTICRFDSFSPSIDHSCCLLGSWSVYCFFDSLNQRSCRMKSIISSPRPTLERPRPTRNRLGRSGRMGTSWSRGDHARSLVHSVVWINYYFCHILISGFVNSLHGICVSPLNFWVCLSVNWCAVFRDCLQWDIV